MKFRRFNWPLWLGLLLTIVAFLSYFFVFVWFPVTRDFPWVNFLLFALAAGLLIVGIRRAFARDRTHPRRSRLAGITAAVLGAAIFGSFIFVTFVLGKRLPASAGAPQLGRKAPDFNLQDTNNNPTSLTALLSTPVNGKPVRGVLLVFYRGYW